MDFPALMNGHLRSSVAFNFSAAKEVKKTEKATSKKPASAAAPKATTKAPKMAKPQKSAPRVGGKR